MEPARSCLESAYYLITSLFDHDDLNDFRRSCREDEVDLDGILKKDSRFLTRRDQATGDTPLIIACSEQNFILASKMLKVYEKEPNSRIFNCNKKGVTALVLLVDLLQTHKGSAEYLKLLSNLMFKHPELPSEKEVDILERLSITFHKDLEEENNYSKLRGLNDRLYKNLCKLNQNKKFELLYPYEDIDCELLLLKLMIILINNEDVYSRDDKFVEFFAPHLLETFYAKALAVYEQHKQVDKTIHKFVFTLIEKGIVIPEDLQGFALTMYLLYYAQWEKEDKCDYLKNLLRTYQNKRQPFKLNQSCESLSDIVATPFGILGANNLCDELKLFMKYGFKPDKNFNADLPTPLQYANRCPYSMEFIAILEGELKATFSLEEYLRCCGEGRVHQLAEWLKNKTKKKLIQEFERRINFTKESSTTKGKFGIRIAIRKMQIPIIGILWDYSIYTTRVWKLIARDLFETCLEKKQGGYQEYKMYKLILLKSNAFKLFKNLNWRYGHIQLATIFYNKEKTWPYKGYKNICLLNHVLKFCVENNLDLNCFKTQLTEEDVSGTRLPKNSSQDSNEKKKKVRLMDVSREKQYRFLDVLNACNYPIELRKEILNLVSTYYECDEKEPNHYPFLRYLNQKQPIEGIESITQKKGIQLTFGNQKDLKLANDYFCQPTLTQYFRVVKNTKVIRLCVNVEQALPEVEMKAFLAYWKENYNAPSVAQLPLSASTLTPFSEKTEDSSSPPPSYLAIKEVNKVFHNKQLKQRQAKERRKRKQPENNSQKNLSSSNTSCSPTKPKPVITAHTTTTQVLSRIQKHDHQIAASCFRAEASSSRAVYPLLRDDEEEQIVPKELEEEPVAITFGDCVEARIRSSFSSFVTFEDVIKHYHLMTLINKKETIPIVPQNLVFQALLQALEELQPTSDQTPRGSDEEEKLFKFYLENHFISPDSIILLRNKIRSFFYCFEQIHLRKLIILFKDIKPDKLLQNLRRPHSHLSLALQSRLAKFLAEMKDWQQLSEDQNISLLFKKIKQIAAHINQVKSEIRQLPVIKEKTTLSERELLEIFKHDHFTALKFLISSMQKLLSYLNPTTLKSIEGDWIHMLYKMGTTNAHVGPLVLPTGGEMESLSDGDVWDFINSVKLTEMQNWINKKSHIKN